MQTRIKARQKNRGFLCLKSKGYSIIPNLERMYACGDVIFMCSYFFTFYDGEFQYTQKQTDLEMPSYTSVAFPEIENFKINYRCHILFVNPNIFISSK